MSYEPDSPSAPNAVHRMKDKAHYDEETVYSILDNGTVAHVTFGLPNGDDDEWPVIIPMIYTRQNDIVFLHGHLSPRLLKTLSEADGKAWFTVTNVHGLVVGLTPFRNTNNYASCVLFGHTHLVNDVEEKTEALRLITNHAFQGGDRWGDSRTPSRAEIQSTRVIAFQIELASAKVRQGGPKDEKKDIDDTSISAKYWSGYLVKQEQFTSVIPSDYCSVDTPEYIKRMMS